MGKVLINWISTCPKCDCKNVLVEGNSAEIVFQGRDAECEQCGHKGEVEVYGPEECDIAWCEDEQPL